MCTDIDDAESKYGPTTPTTAILSPYAISVMKRGWCKECGGKGHKGLKKNSLFFKQCKKCNGKKTRRS